MRFLILPSLVLLILDAAIDFVVYKAIVNRVGKGLVAKIHIAIAALLNLALLSMMFFSVKLLGEGSFSLVMWVLYAYLSVYVPKIIYCVFYGLSLLPRLWKGRKLPAVSVAGAVIAVLTFAVMWWGALINRYNIDVVKEDVDIAGLPAAFEGFTIAQISDLHVGTLGSDMTFISKLVDRINSLNADVVVFTGDIVNSRTSELDPFVSPLSRLKARYGVYSILGNHDYGDYSVWPDEAAKAKNIADLKRMQADMGWVMLNDSTAWIKAGSDSLAIIGVENIGDPPFTVYGSLARAYKDIGDGNTKILLSHNPAHWEKEIMDNPSTNVALSLSGHTHAMQIRLFGVSPAAWRYDRWGGMYSDSRGQRLYVNIGAGTLGMPARIGAAPEITLFTLKSDRK